MIFLEMPAGVGFSFADSPSGYVTNDTQQAVDNFNALNVFFKEYPEYAKNDFYITGESTSLAHRRSMPRPHTSTTWFSF